MYTKLYSSILSSSVWSEDSDTCKVWITLLAMADRQGCVYGSTLGIARIAALPVEIVETAIKKFTSPDERSQDKARGGDGTRLTPLQNGGWKLVNFIYYRDISKADDRREKVRESVSRYRDRHRVIKRNQPSSNVTESNPPEADHTHTQIIPNPDTDQDQEEKKRKTGAFAPPSVDEVKRWISEKGYHFEAEAFHAFYESKGWKVGGQPMRNWKAACLTWQKRREAEGTARPSLQSAGYQMPSEEQIEKNRAAHEKWERENLPPEQWRLAHK